MPSPVETEPQFDAIASSGYVGKYPGYADYVQHGLPVTEVDRLFDWLSSYVDALQTRWGAPWIDVYLPSPVWRFCHLPAAGDSAIERRLQLGAMMPSVDAKGRYFPLLVCVELVGIAPPITTLRRAQALLDELEERLVRCLREPVMPPAELREALLAAFPMLANSSGYDAPTRVESDAHSLAVLDLALANGAGACSVWQVKHQADGCEALAAFACWPTPEQFAELLHPPAQAAEQSDAV
ncbi:MAG: type VI secretion system-associated protein TagF [Pseudomonadota bacterium]